MAGRENSQTSGAGSLPSEVSLPDVLDLAVERQRVRAVTGEAERLGDPLENGHPPRHDVLRQEHEPVVARLERAGDVGADVGRLDRPAVRVLEAAAEVVPESQGPQVVLAAARDREAVGHAVARRQRDAGRDRSGEEAAVGHRRLLEPDAEVARPTPPGAAP